MIDHEDEIFTAVSTVLRNTYEGIYILGYGRDLSYEHKTFPTVTIAMTGNSPVKRYSTFDKLEIVADENYMYEIISNLEEGKEKQCKQIAETINKVMELFGYMRIFNEPVSMIDITKVRRVLRYKKENSIGGN